MGLVMGLCIDELGDALEIKWCPKGGEDEGQSGEQMDVDQDGQTGESVGPAAREGRLGLLAGAFSDGSVAVFDVPAPQDDSAATVYRECTSEAWRFVHADAVTRVRSEGQAHTEIDVARHDVLLCRLVEP